LCPPIGGVEKDRHCGLDPQSYQEIAGDPESSSGRNDEQPLSGNCIAALCHGRISNSTMVDGGIANAAEREFAPATKVVMF